jgi:hypothetical protein
MSFRAGRVFDRVLILMFENQYRSYVLKNPFFRRLADLPDSSYRSSAASVLIRDTRVCEQHGDTD